MPQWMEQPKASSSRFVMHLSICLSVSLYSSRISSHNQALKQSTQGIINNLLHLLYVITVYM